MTRFVTLEIVGRPPAGEESAYDLTPRRGVKVREVASGTPLLCARELLDQLDEIDLVELRNWAIRRSAQLRAARGPLPADEAEVPLGREERSESPTVMAGG